MRVPQRRNHALTARMSRSLSIVTLTVAFEFFFGRVVAKKSWQELLRAYRFENGDIWPLVLMAVTVSPVAAAALSIFP